MNSKTIIVADDDHTIRTVLTQALTRAGFKVRSTATASTLWRWVDNDEGDLIISDVIMPDGDGLDLLPRIKKRRPNLPVIIVSAQNTIMTAIRATEAGAYDYMPKPFDLKELITLSRKAIQSGNRNNVYSILSPSQESLPLIGRSAAMQDVYRIMAKLMHTDLTVTIVGESGTGKELVAKALHNFGKQKKGPFVAINMAAIPNELIESELFGHAKGAFTGAFQRGIGKFEAAQGGTLFLDEIGDMPSGAQTRLLRVLQEGEFNSVGSTKITKTDVRIIAATHQDLRQLIKQGVFREDLFYRLNVIPLRIPPLSERIEDIPDLVRAFLLQAEIEGFPNKTITNPALDLLKSTYWPGNVRELKNFIKRLAVLCSEDCIDVIAIESALKERDLDNDEGNIGNSLADSVANHIKNYFALHEEKLPPVGLYDRVMREVEYPLIMLTLHATRGNQIKAAELLGLNRNTLRKKIKDLDILVTRERKIV